MSFRRPEKPKSVKQKSDEDCWAAALESWLDAVHDPNRRPQEVLIKHSPGGIKTKDFRKWVQSFGMSTRWLVSHRSSPDDIEFTPDYIEGLLKKSVLFVSLEVEPEKETMWFHCVVLYAVTGQSYSVMDPASEDPASDKDGVWIKEKFFPRGEDKEVLVGWQEPGKWKLGTIY